MISRPTIIVVSARASRAKTSRKTCCWCNRYKRWRQKKGVTAGQLALAWVLAQGDCLIPIPGTKQRKYLEENVAALEVTLSGEELHTLEAIFAANATAGLRFRKKS